MRILRFKTGCMGVVFAILVLYGATCFALTAEEENNIAVYNLAASSVVHIRSVVVRHGFFFQPLPVEGTGSGVILDRKGHIVTNAHVIQDARSIEVTLSDGSQWPASLIGSLEEQDLAVVHVQVPGDKLTPIAVGDSKDLHVGQKVLAIGNPFGFQQTLTQGVISSLGRRLITRPGIELKDLIQTDAAINPGNSGGPLLDREGRLIGINTAIVSPSGGSVGVGFAIPVDVVGRHLPGLTRGRQPQFIHFLLAAVGFGILLRLWIRQYRKGPRW